MSDILEFKSTTFSEAAEFYSKYEHLGNPGKGVYHWAAYFEGVMVAAVSFGGTSFSLHRGLFADLSRKYSIRVHQLNRGGTAPFAPKNTGSWIISRSLRALRNLRGDTLVIAYSDSQFNEIGTIYQASNFIFLGMTNPKGQSDYVINGTRMSGWKVRRKFGTRDFERLKGEGLDVEIIPLIPKFRYMYPAVNKRLKLKVIDDLRHAISMYPKRESVGIKPMIVSQLVKSSPQTPLIRGIGI